MSAPPPTYSMSAPPPTYSMSAPPPTHRMSAPRPSCFSPEDVLEILEEIDADRQTQAFAKIQTYVLITIFVLLLQLGHLLKPYAFRIFRLLSWISYILVPILISYILGLMGRSYGILPKYYHLEFNKPATDTFRYLSCIWSIFLLFAYAGFDNLNAFSLEERHERSKLLIQIGIQFTLLILIIYQLPTKTSTLVALSGAFVILAFKFAGRVFALAHSAGATPKIKKDVTRIINYSNRDDDSPRKLLDSPPDPVTMTGFDYLVGAKYAKLEDDRIVDGITMEKVLKSQGRLMKKGNMDLKDTCLSFALFWLLLGKFWSYPLYNSDTKVSKEKAWRMVRHGLLAEKGGHERVFRVIEIELAFLRDYFHARYIFFYLNGFYWKLLGIIALPVMFCLLCFGGSLENTIVSFRFTETNTIVISVTVALEFVQLVFFLTCRWLKVYLLCFYVKKMNSSNTWCSTRVLLELLGLIFLGSSRSSNSAWWRKPWKRELDQYSLVQSCTTVHKPTSYLRLQFISIVGVPFSRLERKLGKHVKMSDQVKEAVVLCLQRSNMSLKLSNGVESLRLNGVMEMLPAWACKLKSDTETILVWHIATSVCELQTSTIAASKFDEDSTNANNMKVATELSKYCAYLLFFAPSLLAVPALVAETTCDTVIQEAMSLFDKPTFGCGGKVGDAAKFESLMNLISVKDEEAGGKGSNESSLLKKGAKLGSDLLSLVQEEEKRWKILAEFWAEMILYLAPSDNNELEHAAKLSQGGEFITQLWALLIHAGIYDRDDIDATFEQDDET